MTGVEAKGSGRPAGSGQLAPHLFLWHNFPFNFAFVAGFNLRHSPFQSCVAAADRRYLQHIGVVSAASFLLQSKEG